MNEDNSYKNNRVKYRPYHIRMETMVEELHKKETVSVKTGLTFIGALIGGFWPTIVWIISMIVWAIYGFPINPDANISKICAFFTIFAGLIFVQAFQFLLVALFPVVLIFEIAMLCFAIFSYVSHR